MFIKVSKNNVLKLSKKVPSVNLKLGSSILLNKVKHTTQGIVYGNGVVEYAGLVGIPQIRHQQRPESSFKKVMQEDTIKPNLIKSLKSLKVSGITKSKKQLNNLRFEL